MTRLLALALILAPSAALAGGPPVIGPQVDVAALQAKVDAANAAAQAAQQAAGTANTNASSANTQAQAAYSTASQAKAAIPPVCSTTPSGDTLNGTVGTSTACTPPANNTRPTSVQAGNTTLAASCAFSVTFARSFTSATPFVYAAVVDGGGNQMPCKPQARSASGFSGICNGAQSTVLSLSVVTSGLTVLPFGTTCTAGTAVTWVAREPTQ